MERDWDKWSYLYVVIAAIQNEEGTGLITVAYVNGIRSMTFNKTKGYEGTYALTQEHVDFFDMFGEAGWELASHDVLATNVVLQSVTYPEMKHFLVFKRPWTNEEKYDQSEIEDLFEQRRLDGIGNS